MSESGAKVTVQVPNRREAEKCLSAWEKKVKLKPDPILSANILQVKKWLAKHEQEYINTCALHQLRRDGSRDRL